MQAVSTRKKKNEEGGSRKTKVDKTSVVKVATGKEWLANKPFEKTPIQKSNSSSAIESLKPKLQGTVQARKQWLAEAFSGGGARNDSFDSSSQWEDIPNTASSVLNVSSSGDGDESSDESSSHYSSTSLPLPAREDLDSTKIESLTTPEQGLVSLGLTTHHFSQERVCIILVQAVVRGHLMRRQMQRLNHAATRIQTHVRCVQSQAMYELQLFAIVLLQNRVRGWLVRKRFEQTYASVLIQSNCRGWLVRKRLEETFAIVLMQSVVRGWLVRKRLEETFAIVFIQSVVRGWLTRKRVRHIKNARHQESSVLLIQAQWRRFQAQSMYELQSYAIVLLQSMIRGCLVRCRLEQTFAAVLLQSVVRGFQTRKKLESRRQHEVSVIVIQSHWRRFQSQSLYELQCFAIVLLQSVFRMFLVQKKLEKTYASALLQALVRGWLARQRMKRMTLAIGFIQSVVRGWMVRKHLKQGRQQEESLIENRHLQETSIILIQSNWRRHQAHIMYEAQSFAIVKLQSLLRVFIVQKKLEKIYASALIQALVRGWLVRRRLEQTFAAAFIQSVVRGWLVRKQQKECRQQKESITESRRVEEASSILIQTLWRRHQAHTMYEAQSFAIVKLQSLFRVFIVQKQLEKIYASALIQALVRGWLVRRRFERALAAAYIQSVARGWLVRKRLLGVRLQEQSVTETRSLEEASSILIQSHWRRYYAKSMYETQAVAIVLLQSLFRVFLVQKQLEKTYSSVLIQAVVRGWLVRKQERNLPHQGLSISENRNLHEASVILIQTQWRRYRAQSIYELQSLSIVLVQSVMRVFLVQKQLEKTYAVALMQSVTRGWLVRRRLERTFAVVLIQSVFRGWQVRTSVESLRRQEVSVRVIQTQWRKFQAHSMYELQSFAIVFLQSVVRGIQTRRVMEAQYEAAVAIQAHWRSRRARSTYRRLRASIVSVQALVRGGQARTQVRFYEECVRTAATSIPALYQCHKTPRTVYRQTVVSVVLLHSFARSMSSCNMQLSDEEPDSEKDLPTHILAAQRGRALVQGHNDRIRATLVLQSWARDVISRRKLRRRFKETIVITRIQTAWRAYRQRTFYNLLKSAVVSVQSAWRASLERQAFASYRRMVSSAIVIQTWIRSIVLVRNQGQSSAATLIQAHWRGFVEKEAYEFYKLLVRSVIVVQTAWRRYYIRKVRARKPLLSLTPSRGQSYVPHQFLFNSSYSQGSNTPSSPSSVTIFTSSEYSAVLASSEVSTPHSRPALVVPKKSRKSVTTTLDLSNPKSMQAPILTWFGSLERSNTMKSWSQQETDAATTVQKAWRGKVDRQRYQQVLGAIKVLQSILRREALARHRQQQRIIFIHRDEFNMQPNVQEICRSPSRAVVKLRRMSYVQSEKAPVLTWF